MAGILNGKVVLVTGGGRGMALIAARNGAKGVVRAMGHCVRRPSFFPVCL